MIDFSKPFFIEEPGTDRIRFTAHGIERLRARFAAAGIDIRDVKTKQEARRAVEASQYVVLDEIAQLAEGDEVLEEIIAPLLPGPSGPQG